MGQGTQDQHIGLIEIVRLVALHIEHTQNAVFDFKWQGCL